MSEDVNNSSSRSIWIKCSSWGHSQRVLKRRYLSLDIATGVTVPAIVLSLYPIISGAFGGRHLAALFFALAIGVIIALYSRWLIRPFTLRVPTRFLRVRVLEILGLKLRSTEAAELAMKGRVLAQGQVLNASGVEGFVIIEVLRDFNTIEYRKNPMWFWRGLS